MAARHRYTEEEDAFLRSFIPGHSEREIADAFEERYGIRLTRTQVKNRKAKLGVKSGTAGGRFEKGHEPANKGKTWEEMGIPVEAQARSRATCFRRGGEPPNAQRVPVGTERVSKDGYVEVKVKRFSDRPGANKCWRMKHHLVWEEANERPVPPSTVIVFANGDKRDFDPGNLVAVPRSLWSTISHQHIPYSDRATLEGAMELARLQSGIHAARTRARVCGACGRGYKPRYVRQRTCDDCLAAGVRAPRKKHTPATPPAPRAKGGSA